MAPVAQGAQLALSPVCQSTTFGNPRVLLIRLGMRSNGYQRVPPGHRGRDNVANATNPAAESEPVIRTLSKLCKLLR